MLGDGLTGYSVAVEHLRCHQRGRDRGEAEDEQGPDCGGSDRRREGLGPSYPGGQDLG